MHDAKEKEKLASEACVGKVSCNNQEVAEEAILYLNAIIKKLFIAKNAIRKYACV